MKVQVIVADEMIPRIDKLAKESGLSRSSFCNFLVADGVRARESANNFMSQLPDTFKEALSNPDIVKAFLKDKDKEG